MLVDQDSGELYLRAARGLNEKSATSFRIKMHDSIAGQVIRTGRPVMIGGVNQEDSFKVKTGYFVKSLLNVPLKVKDRVIGVLAVNNKKTVIAFTERHLNLLMALADYASIAIDNARLYARLSSDVDRAQQSSKKLQNIVRSRTAELKSVNEQLIKTEKLAALGYLAAGVVNEMDTPINNVLDHIRKLNTHIDDSGQSQDLISALERDILHCRHTVDSLLDFSGNENYQIQELFLNSVIENAWSRYVNEYATDTQVEIVRGFDPQLPTVMADRRQMEQAMFYLIRQAYQSMPNGGEVRVTTRPVGSKVQAIIADSGRGISSEDVRHIFDPFYSTNEREQGLDLSITQAIIERHNGTIEVESEMGQGTTFTIQLPQTTT
jgi:signal transduction histidine kinase